MTVLKRINSLGLIRIYAHKGLLLRLVIAASCLASIITLVRFVRSQETTAPATARLDTSSALLSEANRLSWLGNWYRAGTLYERAEAGFRAENDRTNELYARVGRIRAQSQSMPWDGISKVLADVLNDPVAKRDGKLRLWCLAAKGYTELNMNSRSAKNAWTEAHYLANKLGEKEWAARASGELGTIAFLEGNTSLAVSLIGKAIFSAYRTGDTDAKVRLLSMLANGFNEEHRFSEALLLFRRAISTAEANPDAGFPFIAYSGIAQSYIGLGDYAHAREAIDKALLRARNENKQISVAEMLMVSGDLAMTAENLVVAREQYLEASRIVRKLRFNRGIADTMFALSGVERKLGDIQQAAHALEIGLAASQHLGDRYYLPRDYTALAELRIQQGKFSQADRLFQRAEDTLDDIIVNQHSFEESTARAGSMSRTYLEHFRLSLTIGNINRAFQVLERVRGRTVASYLSLQHQSGAHSPRIVKLEGDIAATQLELLRDAGARSRADRMEELLADERKLAFELNEAGLHRRDTLAKPVPLKVLQSALGKDEVVLEFVLDEPNAFCIAITRHSTKSFDLSAGTRVIRELAQSYISELESRRTGESFSRELYRILLEPIEKVFPEHRLVISPDGVLNFLPFEALRTENDFLVRSRIVTYIPSATVLSLLRSRHSEEASRTLLAIGAVDYSLLRELPKRVARSNMTATVLRGLAEISGQHLQDLPASRDEVLTISSIAGTDSQLLLGDAATEAAFKAQPLSDFRIIHMATHAAADPQYPDRAALVLGPATNARDDGLLQVREIVRLPLRADLVTLSACDTDVGAAQGEAGVVDLQQAFLIAGARAVVASLWNVEDNSTSALMKAFYTHLAKHEDKGFALTHAKRDTLDRYPNLPPYYWAGFVMAGEGQEQVPFGS